VQRIRLHYALTAAFSSLSRKIFTGLFPEISVLGEGVLMLKKCIEVKHALEQCFPTFLMPPTPCSECYFTAAPIKSKMEISCILHKYDKNEVINHNFTTLNVSSITMQYCINGDFRMNMNIPIRPNIMNLTLT
jgi:hypothetical protein